MQITPPPALAGITPPPATPTGSYPAGTEVREVDGAAYGLDGVVKLVSLPSVKRAPRARVNVRSRRTNWTGRTNLANMTGPTRPRKRPADEAVSNAAEILDALLRS